MDKFIVDTSSFIQMNIFSKKIFKSLWRNIYEMCKERTFFSVKEVYEELRKGKDDIQEEWREKDFIFLELGENEQIALKDIEQFDAFQKHGDNSPTGLWADPHLIAFGITINAIIITEENLNYNPERKIPYVCNELGIRCMNFDEFMEYQEWEW
ncbi:MAG: DUF4411 family protein [Methanobrevibacter sp.]|nr:DUF4411 family protein [Methanobrevibacter sp.]